MSSLNDKQDMFCIEYLKDLNQTQAAIRAGYSLKTARSIGNRLLTKADIQARISDLKAKRVEKVNIDANYVLKRLVEIDSLDVSDILDEEGNLKPISLWTKEWRTSIDAFDIITLKSHGKHTSAIKSIRMPNKMKNLELLGKHIDVSAFKDRIEHTGENGQPLTIIIQPKDNADNTRDNIEKLKERLEGEQ